MNCVEILRCSDDTTLSGEQINQLIDERDDFVSILSYDSNREGIQQLQNDLHPRLCPPGKSHFGNQ